MNEVKTPKKPMMFYYGIFLAVIILFNAIVMPLLNNMRVKEVDYGTFIRMTTELNVDEVEIQDNQIVFSDKNGNFYKTGLMDDPALTQRLYTAGAKFSTEIVQEMSPILSILLSWILPMALMVGLGQLVMKKFTDKAGGGNSMMFNMGKSNAKIYVKSSSGIKFSDVAGEAAVIQL